METLLGYIHTSFPCEASYFICSKCALLHVRHCTKLNEWMNEQTRGRGDRGEGKKEELKLGIVFILREFKAYY